MRGSPSERFWAKVDDSGDCWLWLGKRNPDPSGGPPYGRFSITASASAQAHRFAYEELIGLIPDGLVLDHLCCNRLCVNPDHLEPVTQRENVLRQARTGTDTHCPHGHEFTPENTYTPPGRGYRQCRACKTLAMRRFNERHPRRNGVRS